MDATDNMDEETDLLRIDTMDLIPFDSSNMQYMERNIQYELNEEEKFQVIPPNNQYIGEHLNECPHIEDYETEYKFEVLIDPEKQQKTDWQYATSLKKIYIKLNTLMNFNVSFRPLQANLFLRAMILFSEKEDVMSPVFRCAHHISSSNANSDVPPHHILRSNHPKTKYCGEQFGVNYIERTSILIPLKSARIRDSTANQSINLEFLCQSSCSTGISRRSTIILFVLESENMDIFGKQVVNFKVCSAPKRDMEREIGVNPNSKKRSATTFEVPSGKKPCKYSDVSQQNQQCIKLEDTNTNNINIAVSATIMMPDKESMLHVLRCAFNEITGQMAQIKDSEQTAYMLELAKKMNALKEQFESNN